MTEHRSQQAQPPLILRKPRRLALVIIAATVAAASLTSFAESYRGLFLWSVHHGLGGLWAAIWPLQVDTFIAVGELALFVALIDRWSARSRTAAWAVTLTGLAVSVAGNIGHVTGHSLGNRGTAAVPPLAAAAALAVGLGVLKRIADQHARSHAPETAAVAEPATATVTTAATEPEELAELAAGNGSEAPALPSPALALDAAAGLDAATLAGAETDSARIRYAVKVLGTSDTRQIVRALTAAGHPVSTENARSVLRRSREKPGPDSAVFQFPARAEPLSMSGRARG